MRCITTSRTVLDESDQVDGNRFGAIVAENELISATLSSAQDLRWSFLTSGLSVPLYKGASDQTHLPDLAALRRLYGSRIEAVPAPLLQSGTDEYSVFVTNVPRCPAVLDVRSQFGVQTIPFSCLVHSLHSVDLLPLYSWILQRSQPGDVIVASSSTAELALKKLLAAVEHQLIRATGKGSIHRPEVVRIPFGVNLPSSAGLDSVHAKNSLKLRATAFVILYVGRIDEAFKADLDPLLISASVLRQKGHDVILVIAGQMTNRSEKLSLRVRAQLLGIEEHVVIIENFPELIKSLLFNACDVFVSPVDCVQETFGLAVAEAMAHAKPVIGTDWAGYRDLIQDGETGILLRSSMIYKHRISAAYAYPISDPIETARYLAQGTVLDLKALCSALENFLLHRELGARMGIAGRKRIETYFSWDAVARRFSALWEEQAKISKGHTTDAQTPAVDGVLSLYASTEINPATIVQTTDESAATLELISDNLFRKPGQGSRLRQLIRKCDQPHSIEALLAEGYSQMEIGWLLKKCFLQF